MLSTEGTGSLNRLIDGLLAELPGTLEPMVRAAIWNTVEDFCVRSGCFRRVVYWGIDTGGGMTTVTSDEGEVRQIVEVYGPERFRIEQPDRLFSLAGIMYGTALVTLSPANLDATPAFIFETWYRIVRVGALARLISEPSKPYTNLELAAPYMQLYEAEVARTLLEAAQVVSPAATDNTDPLAMSRIFANVSAEIPGVANTHVAAAAWNTIEDFTHRSGFYRRTVNFTLTANGTLELTPPAGTRIKQVVEVYGLSRYRIQQPATLFSLQAQTVDGTALVTVTPTALDAPDTAAIIHQWFNAILQGTLGRLFTEPGRPYSAPELAAPFLELYERSVAQAAMQAPQVVSGAIGEPDGLNRLYANIFAEVPTAPHTQIQMLAWNTIEDFCGRSGWFRKTVDWSLADTDTQIQLTSPDGLVNEVVEVYGLDQYRVEQPDRIIPLEPTVASGNALVTLQPFSLAQVPDVLLQTWLETLRSGVLARLLAEAGQPWAAPERATLFAAAYEAGVALAGGQKPQVVSPQALKPDNFDRLYSNIYAELPDVPHTQVQLAAWNCIEEFFIQSTTRREHVFWQMAPGVSWVDFNPFDGDWDVAWILNYTGLYYGKIEPPALLRDLTPPPIDARRTGQAWLALKPKDFLSDVGSLVWSQWFNYIKSGTLYGLYGQPGKSYSSPQLATFYGRRFRAGIVHARSFAAMQYTDGSSWRFPYFAGGRRKS